ncbi:hypothetical protein [Methylophaga sulfidovorans]|uniref:Uncharacterized protein n=1 Tax=Methylophaga sulfidovorans TaxID=45496 RepID=A0A1I3W8H5_9GAMM|nr:hypothetical protein [Methylophaga sulfidovorans]SFK02751.1 hypothetical protein SAMN04488079_10443 [Methylophaga sulfidovorans]
MDSSPVAQHRVNFTNKSLAELKSMDENVTKALFKNFILPIKNGHRPPHDLQGKYKPSWEMPFVNSPMREAFMQQSKALNLFHYHFGYMFYRSGNDPHYPGDISDGIIHTQVICEPSIVSHNILQVCLEHPSPFKQPFERVNDELAA